MKQETKELVDWIKKQINIAKTNNVDPAWDGKYEAYNADYEKAMAFLDSLPEIEARLTRGGYVQDKNGTPCCDSDLVSFLSKSQNHKYGYLIWDISKARFLVEAAGEPDCRYIISELEWFQKVELKEIAPQKILYFEKVER